MHAKRRDASMHEISKILLNTEALNGTVVFEDGNETEEAPYMRGRLKACANVWREIGANELVMSWINEGFILWFEYECPT